MADITPLSHTEMLDILTKVGTKQNFKTPMPEFRENKRSEGYMGDIHYVTISEDEDATKKMQVVLKKATGEAIVREHFPVTSLYENECQFYDVLFPAFKSFQERVAGELIFHKVPHCYETDATRNREMVVLDDLTFKGFETPDKRDTFTKEEIEMMFEEYGRFHAITFAFKADDAKKFEEESNKFFDYYKKITTISIVKRSIKESVKKLKTFLSEEDESEIIVLFEKYLSHAEEIHTNTSCYKGKHGVMTHGDCWSNNVMFKYENHKAKIGLSDVRFLDFQLARIASPVHDLSFCMYSGGTPEIYDNLESYLKTYHKSLTESLKKFKLDAEEVYPFATLKQEWKEYSRFGFIMALMVLGAKLALPGVEMNMADILRRPDEAFGKIDEVENKVRTLALARHMFKNDFL